MVNETGELSLELREAADQMPDMLAGVARAYDSVFTSMHQLLQTLVEAAEREGFRPNPQISRTGD